MRTASRRLPPPVPQPAPHRVPCLRPSAASVRLQPASELGHLPRHGHDRHVSGALLPAHRLRPDPQMQIYSCTRSPRHAACAQSDRSPPPASRLTPPHTVCPAYDPRQEAKAFNQPLSWDTSGVTNMFEMFRVRCSPRALCPPNLQSQASPTPSPRHASCVHATLARRLPPPGSQPAPHRVPCLRPSTAREGLQPAPELGHLPRHGHETDVLRALLPAPRPTVSSHAHTCTLRAPRSRAPYTPAGRGSHIAAYTPHTLPATRQGATSLSAANKLLIRCAWAGTPAFISAGYGPGGSRPGWPLGPCIN